MREPVRYDKWFHGEVKVPYVPRPWNPEVTLQTGHIQGDKVCMSVDSF